MKESQWDRIGDYKLIREIGRGSFGIVYEATQISLDREIALKVMPAEIFPDKRLIERFQIEAIGAAQLRHPNIVRIYESGHDDTQDVYYFSMDYVNGPSLEQVIAERKGQTLDSDMADSHFTESMNAVLESKSKEKKGTFNQNNNLQFTPFTEAECFSIAKEYHSVAEAVSYAHKLGIVHQDIKPSNMVIDNTGRLCLLDFGTGGFQNLKHKISQSNFNIGSPLYSSPEQLSTNFGSVGYQSDIYSLGVTLYEWVTLQLPFLSDNYEELCELVLTKNPVPPHDINPEIPKTLSAIIMKAIERNPKNRYQTTKELADDLQRFINKEPTKAENPGLWRRISLWHGRNTILAEALYSIILLLALSGYLAYYTFYIKPSTPLKQAKKLYQNKAYELVIKELKNITKESKEWTEAMLLKADCLNKLNRPKELLFHCQNLIDHYSDHFSSPDLFIYKAKALSDLNRYEEAVTAFSTAIAKSTTPKIKGITTYEFAKFLNDIGKKQKNPQKIEKAKSEYQKAIKLYPDLAKAHFALGVLLFEQQSYEKAEEQILQAIELRSDEKPKYYAGLGDVYFAWGKQDKAITSYEQAIIAAKKLSKNNNIDSYLLAKGMALIKKKDYEKAVKTLRTSYELGQEPKALYLLAKAQFLCGDKKDAIKTAERIFKEETAVYAAKTWDFLGNHEKSQLFIQFLKKETKEKINTSKFPEEIKTWLKKLQSTAN